MIRAVPVKSGRGRSAIIIRPLDFSCKRKHTQLIGWDPASFVMEREPPPPPAKNRKRGGGDPRRSPSPHFFTGTALLKILVEHP